MNQANLPQLRMPPGSAARSSRSGRFGRRRTSVERVPHGRLSRAVLGAFGGILTSHRSKTRYVDIETKNYLKKAGTPPGNTRNSQIYLFESLKTQAFEHSTAQMRMCVPWQSCGHKMPDVKTNKNFLENNWKKNTQSEKMEQLFWNCRKPWLWELVGGFNTSEKYWSISMTIPNIWKNKKCSKPPTRWYISI